MKYIFKNPLWIDCRLLFQNNLDNVPSSLFEEINLGLNAIQNHPVPFVSVVIPAFNEELNILRTLHSLSQNITTYAVEFIVVNNNSTDRTQEVLDKLNVKSFIQLTPGWGPARQLGQEKASGKYILTADADCFYPPGWIQNMTNELVKKDVACVYGKYYFLGTPYKARWKLFIYERLRDAVSVLRHIKRPWLNSVGMSMGYLRALGIEIGFIGKKIRGEDGRMCFELSQLGKVVRVVSRDVVVWTFPRTLQKDGNLVNSILNRAIRELSRFKQYFYKLPWHDTHTSQNYTPPAFRYFKRYKHPDAEKAEGEVNT